MIKLNRIGYKSGLAGAVGVLLSLGMVANQMVSESTVAGVNDSAERSQRVADSTLTAHLDMRMLQLAGRATRLARTIAEVDKSVVEVHRYEAAARGPSYQVGKDHSRSRQERRRGASVRGGGNHGN